jgi:predicted Zn-dependent protease with MMP-like domain
VCGRSEPQGRRGGLMYSAGSPEKFEELVREALDSIPDEVAGYMSNVDVVVEEAPGKAMAEELGGDPELLLGLYQGIPQTERGDSYSGVLPDRIALYRKNLERAARSRHELTQIIRRTVMHELGHHFGLDDDRLDELGWA